MDETYSGPRGLMKINYGAFCFLPHNRITNHLHVMRQKASSAGHIIAHIPAR
ncbi:hypothetical protein X052_004712 [Salmonella enterica subsp. enterica serovar Livingstone]|nr:hypothetical protein [Salmonella enterica subsp. enterica serovar Livingstone]